MRTIETTRLLLRNICMSDSEDIFEFLSDEQTCLDDGGNHAKTDINGEAFANSMKFLSTADEHYAIVLKDENKVVGMIHIMETERGIKSKEIGYIMNKNYRRQGIAKEAANAVMKELVEHDEVKMFVMTAYEYNTASIATMKSLGFEQEGIIHNDCMHPQKGLIHSVQYYKVY